MKATLDDLALFGGTPAFPDAIVPGQRRAPRRARLEEELQGILDRGFYTNNGPLVRGLEERLAATVGARHAVCVASGSSASMLVAMAPGLAGEVVLPALAPAPLLAAARWARLVPVLADVDASTAALDPADAARRVGAGTAAVFAVHPWGGTCALGPLEALCEERGVPLLVDASQALGSAGAGRPPATRGGAAVLSFHQDEVVNGLDGGCVTTDDDLLADRVRTARNHHATETHAVVPVRVNLKMSEAQAAMVNLGLDGLAEAVADNHRRLAWSRAAFGPLRVHPAEEEDPGNGCHLWLDLPPEASPPGPAGLVPVLRAEGLPAEALAAPPPDAGELPGARHLAARRLRLPCGPTVTREVAERMAALVSFCLEHAGAIRARLG